VDVIVENDRRTGRDSLSRLDEIEYGRKYYYWEDEGFPVGITTVVFVKQVAPYIVSADIFDARGDLKEQVHIFEQYLSHWALKSNRYVARDNRSIHVKVARSNARREHLEWVNRFSSSLKVIRKFQEYPETMDDIKSALARFRACKDPNDDFRNYSGQGKNILNFQSKPTFRGGVHDIEIEHTNGTTYVVSIRSDYYKDKILKAYPDGERLSIGTHTNAAWGLVLEWIDNHDRTLAEKAA
jgi:hypothetical protein